MAAGQDIKAGAAYVEIYASDSELRQQLDAAAATVRSWGSSVLKVGGGLLGVGAAVTAPLIASAKSFATSGSEALHMSERTGLAVGALSELKYAAKMTGGDAESLEGAFRKMQKAIGGAQMGSAEGAKALDSLGLSVGQLAGKAGDEQLAIIADRIASIKDPALQAAAAMQIFGKTGTSMLPLLQNGAAGLAAWRSEASALGLTMSQDAAEKADRLHQAFTRLEMVSGSLWKAFGAAIAPALTDQVNWLVQAEAGVKRLVGQNSAWIQTAYQVGGAFVLVGKAMAGFGAGLFALGMGISGISKLIGVAGSVVVGVMGIVRTGFTLTVTAVQSVLSFGLAAIQGVMGAAVGLASPWYLLGAAVLLVGGYLLYISGAVGRLVDLFKDLAPIARETFGGIIDALGAGDFQGALNIAVTGFKAAWLQIKLWGLGIWDEFTTGVINGWSLVTHKFAEALQYMQAGWALLLQKMALGWNTFALVFNVAAGHLGGDKLAIMPMVQGPAAQFNALPPVTLNAAGQDPRLKALEAELVEAQFDLMMAREEARSKAIKFGRMGGAGGVGDLAALAGKVDVAGTFSGAGARGLMYGQNLQQRTLEVAQQQLDELKGVRQDIRDGGPKFG